MPNQRISTVQSSQVRSPDVPLQNFILAEEVLLFRHTESFCGIEKRQWFTPRYSTVLHCDRRTLVNGMAQFLFFLS